MNIVRGILAIIVGFFGGSALNIGILFASFMLLPVPPGFDFMDPESIKTNIHLLEPKHYAGVFLAHGLGTLFGAFLAAKIAASRKMLFALIVGICFLLGGVYNATQIPAPMWFMVLDLVGAYIPMAWLGGKCASGGSKATTEESPVNKAASDAAE